MNWLRLFPDDDYRFQMGLRPGDAAAFFVGAQDDSLLALRSQLVNEAGEEYVIESTSDAAMEAVEMLSTWTSRPLENVMSAARTCGADFLVLEPDASGILRVAAGAVCFPSSWSLREKVGLRVSEVHAPVPGLNADMERRIDTFLERLAPGTAWERENWGLSADDILDHHPRRTVPPLTEHASLATTWLRLERQLFLRLNHGVLFGIRVSTHRLDELAANDGVAPRLARAVTTMPTAVAEYKGLTAARASLSAQLTAAAT